ncbi:unnamed protein product [Clonostachys solani]|uniref:Uncharacterized protein n=1 Tax=Clonostachys solani TaxID=160281 RepID=A0A9P0EQ73_9HYPO|nr:unnamed protein product [Clonostachys solani]
MSNPSLNLNLRFSPNPNFNPSLNPRLQHQLSLVRLKCLRDGRLGSMNLSGINQQHQQLLVLVPNLELPLASYTRSNLSNLNSPSNLHNPSSLSNLSNPNSFSSFSNPSNPSNLSLSNLSSLSNPSSLSSPALPRFLRDGQLGSMISIKLVPVGSSNHPRCLKSLFLKDELAWKYRAKENMFNHQYVVYPTFELLLCVSYGNR